MITIKLSDEDIEQIREWYEAASGESCTDSDDPILGPKLRDLLLRLGIEATTTDQEYFARYAT